MKRGSTNFLRFFIFLIGAFVLLLCVFALPEAWNGGPTDYPMARRAAILIMLGMEATAIPFFFALRQALRLLGNIDRNEAFSESSVRALRNIKHSAALIAAMYFGGYPLLYPIADADDAPGLIVVGGVFVCALIAVAVFAAVLERLFLSAMAMKTENDLTV